jgi:peroxiredoxin
MDATAGLGGTRFKRSVTLVDNGKIVYTAVEPDSGKSTVTYAENVLKEI